MRQHFPCTFEPNCGRLILRSILISMKKFPAVWLLIVFSFSTQFAVAQSPDKASIESAMKKAATYFRNELAVNGGYVYFYSRDLQRRLGEGPATPTEIWVQPPGTPTVGMAYLAAWEATGDNFYLEAAREVGEALIYGQLESGGWRNSIDFDPAGPRIDQYRNGKGKGKNFSSLDDGITQAALQMLIQLDGALKFQAKNIHEAAEFGLKNLLQAQFANGAFPQGWDGPVSQSHPEKKANYPDYDWRTEGRIKEYWDLYNLNDDIASDVAETLLEAIRVYDKSEYKSALAKLGDFLILAQMPEPQPAWAQQYNYDMQPVWARKFEPPAIAGAESQGIMETLLKIYRATGDKKYLEPVVPGVKYLQRSLLPDGKIARYYELENNKPLYMSRKGDVYSLTNSDSNLPSHYGWKWESRLDDIIAAYREVAAGNPFPTGESTAADLVRETRDIIQGLDDLGRWISIYKGERLIGQAKFREGDEYISSEVFSKNLQTLSRALQ